MLHRLLSFGPSSMLSLFLSTFSFSTIFFFLMIRRPPSSPLFPYTTLFQSGRPRLGDPGRAARFRARGPVRVGAATSRRCLRAALVGPVDAGWRACRGFAAVHGATLRSEEHTSELQSHSDLV